MFFKVESKSNSQTKVQSCWSISSHICIQNSNIECLYCVCTYILWLRCKNDIDIGQTDLLPKHFCLETLRIFAKLIFIATLGTVNFGIFFFVLNILSFTKYYYIFRTFDRISIGINLIFNVHKNHVSNIFFLCW